MQKQKENNLDDGLHPNTFVSWYKQLIDKERHKFCLYLADSVTLDWFGKTIKTRKKVAAFFKYETQMTRHYFNNVEKIDEITPRIYISPRKKVNSNPPISPEPVPIKTSGCKRPFASKCDSPEWAEGCNSGESNVIARKRLKDSSDSSENIQNVNLENAVPVKQVNENKDEISSQNPELTSSPETPTSSSVDPIKLQELLSTPKFAVECRGYVEFVRTKSKYASDGAKWERKCKIQISYSRNCINTGEYVIWAMHYTDENKCKRNLLKTFEALDSVKD